MKEFETLKLFRGATSVIELDFTGFNFENGGYCQLLIKKKYNGDIVFQHDFKKPIKYYVTFKDEFTVGLDDNDYKYDIMYMLKDERYPQCSISDIIIDEVVNDYKGEFDENAVQVTEVLTEGTEITQSIKVTTSNVIIASSNLQERTVTPTKEEQVVLAEDGFDGMSKVVVEAIPSDYVIPSLQDKTIEIKPTENKYVMADEGFNGLGVVNVVGTIDTETKEVTPSKEVQNISRSEGKYIDSVTVNAIPDNYIEPSGELDITENGSYDVTDKASVKVETSGADLSEYFGDEIVGGNNDTLVYNKIWTSSIKKLPPLKNTGTMSYLYSNFSGTEIDTSALDFTITTSMKNIFNYCQNLTILDVSNFDTSNVTDMQYVFCKCKSLTNLDVSEWDTTNVTNMQGLFLECSNLTNLDLSKWNTSNVTNMGSMFGGCTNLTSLDVSNFDTSEVTDMSGMFDSCRGLTSIDTSNFDTGKVTTMRSLFNGCINLTSLDLTNFNTSNVTSMEYMFMGCPALTNVDLSGLDTSNLKAMGSMFEGCRSLTEINISSFNLEKIVNHTNFLQNRNSSVKKILFGYNLGKGYTKTTANYSYYKVDFSKFDDIDHDSVMSIINGLYDLNLTYDVANGGTLYTQQLVLGSNKSLLTEEELAVATNKGWSVS